MVALNLRVGSFDETSEPDTALVKIELKTPALIREHFHMLRKLVVVFLIVLNLFFGSNRDEPLPFRYETLAGGVPANSFVSHFFFRKDFC